VRAIYTQTRGQDETAVGGGAGTAPRNPHDDRSAPPRRGGPGMSVQLESGTGAASEARAALSVLDGRIDGRVLDDIRLLVSELVSNSVRHASAGPAALVNLHVTSHGRTVRAEVSDEGPGFAPHPRRSRSRDDVGGWGLHLVESIADRWGVDTGRRTRVWFELDS
jgi:anti-sigma regulatory factor (Ser/Thr protein kinase)